MGICNSTLKKTFNDFKLSEDISKLRTCGVLEDMEIVVGIDVTKSNEWTGEKSYISSNLHHLDANGETPYSSVIGAVSKFLERDLDSNFPLYFFGSVESKKYGGAQIIKECKGIEDLINTYKDEISKQTLYGPTTFAPLIEATIDRVRNTNKFHMLIIITDGAIT